MYPRFRFVGKPTFGQVFLVVRKDEGIWKMEL
jgi:hypothetical protein